MKVYRYNRKAFNFEVTFIGVFCAALVVLSLVSLLGYPVVPRLIAAVVLVIAGYQVWNTFGAIANPETVTISDDAISFGAYGRTDTFRYDEIERFNIREMGGRDKLYIRINGGNLLHGRYWVQTAKIDEGGDELFEWLEDFEMRVDPDSIKSQARRSNLSYDKHRDEIEASLKRDKQAKKNKRKKNH